MCVQSYSARFFYRDRWLEFGKHLVLTDEIQGHNLNVVNVTHYEREKTSIVLAR